MEGNVAAIVLAAGQGKRLKSKRPKVLHEIAGRSLVAHVLAALDEAGIERVVVVGPADIEPLREALASLPGAGRIGFATQDPPLGIGDAVKKGLAELGDWSGTIVVANGDTPLVTAQTFRALLEELEANGAAAALVTARVSDPNGLGRIVRGSDDRIAAIVEDADATPEMCRINEINGGVYAFKGE